MSDKVPDDPTEDNSAEPYHGLVPLVRAWLIATTVVGGFVRGFAAEERRRRDEERN